MGDKGRCSDAPESLLMYKQDAEPFSFCLFLYKQLTESPVTEAAEHLSGECVRPLLEEHVLAVDSRSVQAVSRSAIFSKAAGGISYVVPIVTPCFWSFVGQHSQHGITQSPLEISMMGRLLVAWGQPKTSSKYKLRIVISSSNKSFTISDPSHSRINVSQPSDMNASPYIIP